MRSGWSFSIGVAIDYSHENYPDLKATNPDNLHKISESNRYLKAIQMVGQVLAPYDPDQKFPVFGFAGFPRHMSELSKKEMNRPHHGFPVNGKPYAPEVDGLDGILAAYKNSMEETDLTKKIGAAGVSNLAELLVEFKKYTVRNTAKKQY